MLGGHKLRKLLKTRADPNEMHKHGFSALHRACDPNVRNLEAAALLLEARGDVNLSGGSDNQTPLHKALSAAEAKHCSSEIVMLLLRHRADVNAQTGSFNPEQACWHQTPLHIATRNGRKAEAELLLEAAADSNLQTATGLSPLQMSSCRTSQADQEILALFAAHGHRVLGKPDLSTAAMVTAVKPPRTTTELAAKFCQQNGYPSAEIPIHMPPSLNGPFAVKLAHRITEQN